MASNVPGQSSQDLSLQIPQDPSGPDPLVSGDGESGDPTGPRPLAQELPGGVENLDPLVVAIGDVNPALRVGHQVVGQSELAGTLSSAAPFQQIFPVTRVLHHPGAAVPVADVDIAIGGEGDVGRQIEVAATR